MGSEPLMLTIVAGIGNAIYHWFGFDNWQRSSTKPDKRIKGFVIPCNLNYVRIFPLHTELPF